jgi:hypothetical protein
MESEDGVLFVKVLFYTADLLLQKNCMHTRFALLTLLCLSRI